METQLDALGRLADGLCRVADEMAAERRALQQQVVALSWRGLAAEAVRGALDRRACALAEARERFLDAADALVEHTRRLRSRHELLVETADRIEWLFS